jgi:hypothetical protein
MAESRIKDENYYQVQGWMLNRLGLKGTALDVYAIIYAFSQDGESWFSGSLKYLADFTNVTTRTIISTLKDLTEKGYLVKWERLEDGVKFCSYRAIKDPKRGGEEISPGVKKLHEGGEEISSKVVKKLHGGHEEISHNNKLDNKSNNKEDNKLCANLSKKAVDAFFDSLWQLYPNKKGKGRVSDAKKKALYLIGIDEMTRVIDRYKKVLKKETWRKPQDGSTFFNGGYVDYLDENYSQGGEIDGSAEKSAAQYGTML